MPANHFAFAGISESQAVTALSMHMKLIVRIVDFDRLKERQKSCAFYQNIDVSVGPILWIKSHDHPDILVSLCYLKEVQLVDFVEVKFV